MRINGIVLAAGQGKRMKSKLYKVLHPVCGKPMVGHVVDLLDRLDCERRIVVVGHGADKVKDYLGSRTEFALQEQQLGTGHAVLQAKEVLGAEEGLTFVLYGDTPLIKEESLQEMIRLAKEQSAAGVVLTAEVEIPFGLGRILRDENGSLVGIVEEKDCTPEQAAIREINTGIYCFDNRKLFAALEQVTNQNAQGEYYLTDVISILRQAGETLAVYKTPDSTEGIGVNDRVALSEAEAVMKERINRKHMLNGVSIQDPSATYIEADVVIGSDTRLLPGTILRGATVIGEDCVIGPNTDITDSDIADGAEIKHSVLLEASVGRSATVGPFAYLRPGAKLGEKVKVGDFVEIKNATLGAGSKVSHLSYVGDAVVGKNVNMGCGSITVNYDGFNKHKTEIGDDAFVGSNVNLIAPVTIGKGAFVVAGSTITKNVEEDSLAVARERQSNKAGYAAKLRARLKNRPKDEDE
ncbi:bifunctional UDP-N-acetylglucosamine diphosphorylase/glucosamine-1-phosphate N-acetyltransferase GlmU [Gorillibacterium timonense]|uniref:bifunctional UDP-N-acetylglucosamine diphosphorylase/glucosamine-1-phosphate N-acetyltransferase GlmU n=1 Tax=Gorillibacterium timonense TaxID=1689269 RepID=UPI00071D0357|nr:bifunctional UDP-N-acetylglucosamine diphosphorylase/glucosamine-1-phosphate N-acetyltransferase GlmU [Gorillibacterium timonense]